MKPSTMLKAVAYLASQDPEMPMTRLQIFLFIAQRKQCLVRDLTKLTGLNQSTVARSLAALGSKPSRSRPEGLKWVETYPDPTDPRRQIVKLTAAGDHALQQTMLMLE